MVCTKGVTVKLESGLSEIEILTAATEIFHGPQPRRKKQFIKQFSEVWKAFLRDNLGYRTDVLEKRAQWNTFLAAECREKRITDKEYGDWAQSLTDCINYRPYIKRG